MKKLLALILCVMMFVAVIPTSAFADGNSTAPTPAVSYPATTLRGTAVKDAITTAKDAVKLMQGTVVANETIFGSIKTIDDVIVSMAKGMFADYEPYDANDPSKDSQIGSVKAALRGYVGSVINAKMTANAAYYWNTDSNGNKTTVNPEKYLKKYLSAYSDAVTSAEAQRYFEAVLTTAMANAMVPSIEQQMADLKDTMADWEDGTSIWAGAYGFTDDMATGKTLIADSNFHNNWAANNGLLGSQMIID